MCRTHKHLGSAPGNEIVVPATSTATLEQRSEKADPRIEDRSQRALPDRTQETRAKLAESLGGGDGMDVPSVNETTVDFAISRINQTKPTVPSTPKPQARSDRDSSSNKKNDPRGNEQRPSKPKPAASKPITPIAKTETPKEVPPVAPITANSAPQKSIAPYAQPAASITIPPKAVRAETPKPAATEKKELGAEELRQIRSVIESGWSRFAAIPKFQSQNRGRVRDSILNAVFSAAGETVTGTNRFPAAKRLAKQAGGQDLVNIIMDLHKN